MRFLAAAGFRCFMPISYLAASDSRKQSNVVDSLLAVRRKDLPTPSTPASLPSALYVGINGPGASWGPISSPGPFSKEGPGLLGLLSSRRSQMDQRVTSSHPNTAVDVATPTFKVDQRDSRVCFLFLCSRARLIGFLSCRLLRCGRVHLPQRLIDRTACPQPMEQHRQLACHCYRRSFFSSRPRSLGSK
jgi:hypothetical protein